MIGTRILKIDLEIAEIIEVKVAIVFKKKFKTIPTFVIWMSRSRQKSK